MRFSAVIKDERGFIHKKLLGLGKSVVRAATGTIGQTALGFIPGGSIVQRGLGLIRGLTGPLRTRGGQVFAPPVPSQVRFTTQSAATRAWTPTIPTARPTLPRTQTARVTVTSQAQKNRGANLKFGDINLPSIPEAIDFIKGIRPNGNGGNGNGGCPPDLIALPGGGCEFPGSPRGEPGEARMGRYGAALDPMFRTINQRVCLEGMILGKDRLCYNKGAISNKERLWPKGTAPLLTGGEMAAIRKADRARGKVARTAKRLGIQPATRRAPRMGKRGAHAHAKAATGVVSV